MATDQKTTGHVRSAIIRTTQPERNGLNLKGYGAIVKREISRY